MEEQSSEREGHLRRVLDRLFAVHEELTRTDASQDARSYSEKLRTIHRLKEEYKRHTGVYPRLPPYDSSPLSDSRPI